MSVKEKRSSDDKMNDLLNNVRAAIAAHEDSIIGPVKHSSKLSAESDAVMKRYERGMALERSGMSQNKTAIELGYSSVKSWVNLKRKIQAKYGATIQSFIPESTNQPMMVKPEEDSDAWKSIGGVISEDKDINVTIKFSEWERGITCEVILDGIKKERLQRSDQKFLAILDNILGIKSEANKTVPLFIEKKIRRLQLLLQPSLYERVVAVSKSKGISVNALIHAILEVCTKEAIE